MHPFQHVLVKGVAMSQSWNAHPHRTLNKVVVGGGYMGVQENGPGVGTCGDTNANGTPDLTGW